MNNNKNREVKAMSNVKAEVVKGKLVLTIDLDASKKPGLELTGSGNSFSLGTTHGFQKLQSAEFGNIQFSVNAVVEKKPYEQLVADLAKPATSAPKSAPATAPTSDVSALSAKVDQLSQIVLNLANIVSATVTK